MRLLPSRERADAPGHDINDAARGPLIPPSPRTARIAIRPDDTALAWCRSRSMRSVWFFEKRKISRHRRHGFMCHPRDRDSQRRAWVTCDMQRWGLALRPRMLTGGR
jgi:hypothetical protein